MSPFFILPLLISISISISISLPLPTYNHTTPQSLCTHPTITCNTHSQITKLLLQNLSLTGPFPLTLLNTLPLSSLRVLSLSHNSFSGPLPSSLPLPLPSLKLLFLSHNRFSGPIPASLSSLPLLLRLDLSHNSLSGPLPVDQLNRITHLLTLRLEGNNLTGNIAGLQLPDLQELNISANSFTGQIPRVFAGFPATSFYGNAALCGPPLAPCKQTETDPTKPGNLNPGPNQNQNPTVTISSTPSALPGKLYPKKPGNGNGRGKMSLWAIIAIIVGDVLLLALISALLYCYFWRKKKGGSVISGGEKIVYSSSPYRGSGGGIHGGGVGTGGGRMVFSEGVRRFELEDLLRASAEMLGKGVFGTAYKAVLDDGTVVAVKRLKEANVGGSGGGKKEFEQLMEVLGKLRHPNLVTLKAYYFARDEKLLVFDYLPNGSLFWLLHGNRGPGRTPLEWTVRLKIAAGAARGVAFIHNSCRELKLIHGNIKSTNILIDKAGDACVSDFGLSSFSPLSANNCKSNGYRAPESRDGRRLTQKADVYSFGVFLLELLTGKYPSVVEGSGPYGTVGVGGVVDLPKWVQSVVREEWTAEVFDLELMRYKDIEEEMVGLLQIAMACTSMSSDQRPRMSQVVQMIEEIRGVEASPAHDNFDSDSPCVSDDTGGVSQ
ncbi:putative leucine-rich repeat receptor-like protein kinase At1g68400 [Silene latifolia]|uniref:putative leucine-rich repeat receptor-like protein kinase At1g68400 n=1 Tax=Silene latifolia TaxID=37657 RepID=UPI003D77C9B1